MTVIDLRERLMRLRDPERARRAERDADMIERIAAKVRAGRLRATSLDFDSTDGEVDVLILTLRSD